MIQFPQIKNQYLYTTNYSKDEESLCKLEIKCLFGLILEEKHFISDTYVDPSRSPFIKNCITIMYMGETMQDIIVHIVSDKLLSEKYKVTFINSDGETLGFHHRRNIEREVGLNILGEYELENPKINFGITKLNDKWIFGELESNNSQWLSHNKKPFSYSNALKVNVSRALVNIAVGNNLNHKVIDPCCGIGTVLIEALSMGIDIKGYEINPSIGYNAIRNLNYFGYEDIITIGDMTTIEDIFDIAIIDLPYGIFTQISPKEQLAIIESSRRLAKKLILITFEDMETEIKACGFNIEDQCTISKGNFVRHISICI
jgi:tRNA (guanine10-N2)-dimethyltransferase